MRRNHLGQLVLDGYLMMSESEKEDIMEYVFRYYYDRNDMNLDTALDEILGDLVFFCLHFLFYFILKLYGVPTLCLFYIK